MLKGQLWATSDMNLVGRALSNGFKAIYLGDPLSVNPAFKDKFVYGTALIPDYQAMEAKVDGNEELFFHMYISSLKSGPATEMMSVILACLFKGTSIILYLPPDASSLNFAEYLLQFIQLTYGITTQTQSTQFAFNIERKDMVMELLYLNNLASPQEYLINSGTVSDNTLRKLVQDLHPMVENPRNLDDILKWFSNYKDKLIYENRPLINGVQYAGETGDYVCC